MNRDIGKIGEDMAATFLLKKGFFIRDRNYLKKYGEIDIVAEKNSEIYFVEVKTLSVNFNFIDANFENNHRPEEKINNQKLTRLGRAVRVYILEKRLENREWHFLVVSVLYEKEQKRAEISMFEDVLPG